MGKPGTPSCGRSYNPEDVDTEPIPAEFSVQLDMFCWPTIFSSRKHVLGHYFFTIGNGRQWENGALVGSKFNPPGFCVEAVMNMMRKGRPDDDIWAAVRRLLTDEFRRQDHPDEFIANVLIPNLPPHPEPFDRPYPLGEFSRLLTIPQNVQPGWLGLWKEALSLAESVPVYDGIWRDGEFEHSSEYVTQRNAKQAEWAKRARERAYSLGIISKPGVH